MFKEFIGIGLAVLSFSMFSVQGEENDVESYFDKNLYNIKKSYEEYYGDTWNLYDVDYVNEIFDLNDKKIGHLVVFNEGFIAYGNEWQLFKYSNKEKPEIYNKNKKIYYFSDMFLNKENECFIKSNGEIFDPNQMVANGLVSADIYYPIDSKLDNKGFAITSSCTKIPQLKDRFDSSSWGDYKPVSFYQGDTTDCGVIAIMDLLYTFKLSGTFDYTNGCYPKEARESLRGLTNWQGNIAGEGMLPFDMVRGCNNFINRDNVKLKTTSTYYNLPSICFYTNLNIANNAHFAMKVGEAQQDYWWVFKTYWDIIISWDSNYYSDSNGVPTKIRNYHGCYYVVDGQYRQSMYQLYDGDKLVA